MSSLLQQLMQQQNPEPGQSESQSISAPIEADPAAKARAVARTDSAIGTARATVPDAKAESDRIGREGKASIDQYRNESEVAMKSAQDVVDSEVKPLLARQKKIDADYEQALSVRDDYTARMQTAVDDMDKFGKQIAAEQPHEFWTDKSVPMKIAAIALAGLGGAAQAAYGDRTNAAVDEIDTIIKRDLMLQKMRIDKDQKAYDNQGLLLNRLSSNFDHIEHAQDAAYVTAMQGMVGRLNAVKMLLTSPQMRQNMDTTIAHMEMKVAEAQQKLTENTTGKAVRLEEGIMQLQGQREKNESSLGTAKVTAATAAQREARLGAKEGRDQNALEVPGWQFPDGFKGQVSEAKALRDGETTTRKVSDAMDRLSSELDKVNSPLDLLSTDAYREYHQAEAQLIEAARGPGFGQTGSRLTKMLKDLEEAAFTPGALGRTTPGQSKVMIKRAQAMIWDNMKSAFARRGGKPYHHDVFGD